MLFRNSEKSSDLKNILNFFQKKRKETWIFPQEVLFAYVQRTGCENTNELYLFIYIYILSSPGSFVQLRTCERRYLSAHIHTLLLNSIDSLPQNARTPESVVWIPEEILFVTSGKSISRLPKFEFILQSERDFLSFFLFEKKFSDSVLMRDVVGWKVIFRSTVFLSFT